jgi:thioredoxin 1
MLCAQWCGVCRGYADVFAQVGARFPQARFMWVDVEDQADLVDPIEVDTFPTLLIAAGRHRRSFSAPWRRSAGTLERIVREHAARMTRPRVSEGPTCQSLVDRLDGLLIDISRIAGARPGAGSEPPVKFGRVRRLGGGNAAPSGATRAPAASTASSGTLSSGVYCGWWCSRYGLLRAALKQKSTVQRRFGERFWSERCITLAWKNKPVAGLELDVHQLQLLLHLLDPAHDRRRPVRRATRRGRPGPRGAIRLQHLQAAVCRGWPGPARPSRCPYTDTCSRCGTSSRSPGAIPRRRRR